MGAGVNTNNTEVPRLIKLVSVAARTKGDMVAIGTGNLTYGINDDVTIADGTTVARYAVAMQDAASGAVYSAAEKGTVDLTVPSGTYTMGYGLKIDGGAITSSGSNAGNASGAVGNNLVAICRESGTAVTTLQVTLYGFAVTPTT